MNDPLAIALWDARAQARPLARADWPDVALERGRAVAAELYARLRADGAEPVGAKIGATDAAAQQRLGTDGPFVGPLFSDACIASGSTLALADFVAPALELEIGLRLDGDAPTAVACVEIVDSRFAWDVAIGHATADFGCQGRMLFGDVPSARSETVRAVARRDGEEVARGEGAVADLAPLVALARPALEHMRDRPPLVASGSLIAPVPLAAGDWELDFGALGTLALTVRA